MKLQLTMVAKLAVWPSVQNNLNGIDALPHDGQQVLSAHPEHHRPRTKLTFWLSAQSNLDDSRPSQKQKVKRSSANPIHLHGTGSQQQALPELKNVLSELSVSLGSERTALDRCRAHGRT